MALRIYSLAKELKIDSKELVDICAKAGVTGKGSALASLTDEEVVKLKAYLAGGAARHAPPKPAAPAAPAPPSAPLAPQPPSRDAMRREDYVAPTGASGRPPVMPPRTERPAGDQRRKPPAGDAPPKSAPAIKLAPLPPSQQPVAPAASSEPAPQKPDIKLPPDAIRASKLGSKPLQEHMRKHEARRRDAETTSPPSATPSPPGGPRGPQPATPPLDLTPGRERRRTGGPKEVAATGEAVDLGGRELRQLKRKRAQTDRPRPEDEGDSGPSRRITRQRRGGSTSLAPHKGKVTIELPCTVRSLCETAGIPARMVLGKLLALGKMGNINAEMDAETLEFLGIELGIELEVKRPLSIEDQVLTSLEQQEDSAETLEPRPPIVTFLGHVDHGKTSLLDRIIGTNVVSGESGGITQHIRAYRVENNGRPIAFVDTPGHEAFTEMRARGANVTDVAVLVVAADDGIMPQTEEAISHARAAGVPLVVALNKIDLPGININRIYEQLAANDLLPSEWGGETEVCKCSALTGQGVDTLLETILTLAELHDYRANPHRQALGTCLESELHEERGVMAKLIVQKGTLHVGDVIVCGAAHGRVKAMYDTLDGRKTYQEVGPSTPVNVTGLDIAPGAGEHFYVLDDITQAREIAEQRAAQSRKVALGGGRTHITLENLLDHIGTDTPTLNLILRADTRGSIEAIQKELLKLSHPEVQVKVLQATVGGITEADVYLADASDAVIIGFNVVPDEKARAMADQRRVQIRRYDIIYKLAEDLKAALEGMLKPEERETELGRALVLRLFTISRVGTVAGCRVLSGTIERNCRIRLIRENRVIGDYGLGSLRREKDDAKEVREGFECGIRLANYNDLKEGDVLEAYKIEEVARTL
ncbi:MAG: translation initiation factor IF-2 [Pirellulales bacterium]|nr:translation initiation factor IF-2 [Pirellulales bacterium]